MGASGRVLIVDNGGHTIKAGWSNEKTVKSFSNGIFRSKRDKRFYVGDQLENECTDYGGLHDRIPCERGIICHWDVQKTVWDRMIGPSGFNIDPEHTSLLVTEPVLNLPNVQHNYDQIIFEEFEFQSYLRIPAAALAPADAKGNMPECIVVIDSGFSFTNIVPMLNGEVVWSAVRRVDVGGKLLTNHLKELVSFRQWYMMDQTHVMSAVKDALSFVSLDFGADLDRAHANPRDPTIARAWVLPDFAAGSKNYLGYPLAPDDPRSHARPAAGSDTQMLWLANERFAVPEILFKPSIIGLKQPGLADATADAIASLPADIQGLFWGNILCVGGNACMPGLGPRLERELRALAPCDYPVAVTVSDDPIHHALRSARALLKAGTGARGGAPSVDLRSRFVTRAEYEEQGSRICRERFDGPPLGPEWRPMGGLGDVDEESLEDIGTDEGGSSDERKKAKRLETRMKQQARLAKSRVGSKDQMSWKTGGSRAKKLAKPKPAKKHGI